MRKTILEREREVIRADGRPWGDGKRNDARRHVREE
jgi:hypothetical protein